MSGLPAPRNDPLETTVIPCAALSVTPMLSKPTAATALMVAICSIDALRAALSACGITPNTFSHQPLQFCELSHSAELNSIVKFSKLSILKF